METVTEDLEKYLLTLNPEQKAAVEHEGSPLLILAGAGSGKTRVITTKVAYLIQEKLVDPFSILSVTFTKKAANEMRQRAIGLEPRSAHAQIRTFHSFGSWFLRKYSDAAGLIDSFTVYDDDASAILIKKAVPSLSSKECHLAAKQIALAKDYCLGPEDDLSILNSEFDINDIYDKYEKRLKATGNTDFGDLIMLPYLIMEQEEAIASSIHSRFKVIMVDEYQDSNIAQFKLLQKISGVKEGNDSYVCVVGDDDQSIYHFRGAEVSNILSFSKEFPGTQIIKLERNYRSTAKILHAADMVVNNNTARIGKTLIAERGEGGTPVLAFLDDSNQETGFCAELIQKSVDNGGKYSDWALLYRTNAQSLGFEKEFIHRKIPYVVVGSLKFYEREEIKDALAYLALCANPKDEISFGRIVNKPARGIGEKKQDLIIERAFSHLEENGTPVYDNLITALEEVSNEFPKKAKEQAQEFVKLFKKFAESFNSTKKLSEVLENIIFDSGLEALYKAEDEVEGTQRVENLRELINTALPYSGTVQGLVEFLDAINLDRTLAAEEETKVEDSVTLITLHNTKGLEFNKVIITGLEDGVFPRTDKQGADLEEERRLFYVGITRAKDELYVTSAARRVMYGSWQIMRPSGFLSEAKDAFKMIGKRPYMFATAGQVSSFGATVETSISDKWKKGTKVYNDDFGYGVVIQTEVSAGELIITVQFESGGKKKFLPQYQSKKLMIVKD